PQIGVARVSLHDSDPFVPQRDLSGHSRVAARFTVQVLQVFEGAPDQQLAGGSRSGKALDRVVQFEKDGMGEAADLLESALRAPRLPERGDAEPDNQQQRNGGRRDRNPMAAEEFAGAIAPGGGAGLDRPAVEVATDVFGEVG